MSGLKRGERGQLRKCGREVFFLIAKFDANTKTLELKMETYVQNMVKSFGVSIKFHNQKEHFSPTLPRLPPFSPF